MTDYAAIFRAGAVPPAVTAWALGALGDVAGGASDLRAVRHPLGFLCFPVERQDECGVCVHVWSRQLTTAVPTTSGMHAHSWELLSLVLSGELRNLRLTVHEGRPPTHRVYEVHSGPDGDMLAATSRLVRFRLDGSDVNRAGDTYTVRAGDFHATIAEEATTIAIGMARPGKTDLSLGAIDGHTHDLQRERCDKNASVSAASLVLRQLAEARR